MSLPGLEPRLLEPDTSALTMRPLFLLQKTISTTYKLHHICKTNFKKRLKWNHHTLIKDLIVILYTTRNSTVKFKDVNIILPGTQLIRFKRDFLKHKTVKTNNKIRRFGVVMTPLSRKMYHIMQITAFKAIFSVKN